MVWCIPTLAILFTLSTTTVHGFSTLHLQRRTVVGTAARPSLFAFPTETASQHGDDNDSTLSSQQQQQRDLDQILSVIPDDKSCSLRPAIQFLETHPDMELSRTNFQAIFDAIELVTANAEENDLLLSNKRSSSGDDDFPIESRARTEMTDMYQLLAQRSTLSLFGVADTTQPLLAAGPRELFSSAVLETILDPIPQSALTPSPSNSNAVLLAGAVAASLEALVSVATGIPLNLLFLATLVFFGTDRAFLNGAIFESIYKIVSPSTSAKILRHEAGHFLLAYLTGCPVEGTVLSAWAALQDRRFTRPVVQAGTSFYDPILADQLNRNTVTSSALDRYSIIVMAGIAAEAVEYGVADGGSSDEAALIQLLSVRCQFGADKIRTQARWGAVQAVLLLRQYASAYTALVDALERGGNLGECVYAMEQAARAEGLPTRLLPLGVVEKDAAAAAGKGDGVVWMRLSPEQAQANIDAQEAAARTTQRQSSNKNQDVELDTVAALSMLRDQRRSVEESLQEVERRLRELD